MYPRPLLGGHTTHPGSTAITDPGVGTLVSGRPPGVAEILSTTPRSESGLGQTPGVMGYTIRVSECPPGCSDIVHHPGLGQTPGVVGYSPRVSGRPPGV